jgi:4-carboxymuconolactone decarboxylase
MRSGELNGQSFSDIAPALSDYTDKVLFGDVWKRPGLSPRDRSLVTVTSLVALYRINELPLHLRRALDNGVTREELIEAITHLAFYAGAKLRRYGLNDAEGGDE